MKQAIMNTHFPMKRHLTRKTRLILDIALVLAIAVALAFLATRANAMSGTKLIDTLRQNNAVNQEDPILRSAELESVSDLIADLKKPNSSVRVNAAIVFSRIAVVL